MSIDIDDRTGMPVPVEDFSEAIEVVTKYMLRIAQVPPELAVQLGNVKRCLEQGRLLTIVVEEQRAKTKEESP
jgi:hypothetical protein